MIFRIGYALSLTGALLVLSFLTPPVPACCPAPPRGKPVVNADQTVLIVWDAATKTQHFIRQASFKSDADDFGFLVPSPSKPELSESGNDAFPYLRKLTEPETQKVPAPSGGVGCGCAGAAPNAAPKGAAGSVQVLEEKLVAGFKASVLAADSTSALVGWLKDNGYAFSPEVEAWAKPYVDQGWKITALKVAKGKDVKDTTKGTSAASTASADSAKTVAASALRMTFQTDRPLFPYREPDSRSAAETLGAKHRLLRIYFVGEARYTGELTKEVPWTGKVAWSDKLTAENRTKALELLKLPETTGPSDWWLTEFEDDWPYQVAPADVYFTRAATQDTVKRPPIVQYVSASWPTDVSAYALAGVLFLPPLLRRIRRRR